MRRRLVTQPTAACLFLLIRSGAGRRHGKAGRQGGWKSKGGCRWGEEQRGWRSWRMASTNGRRLQPRSMHNTRVFSLNNTAVF
uniref:Predicted protein n=1 Tax=Hordeum vulgare subsp. vulgare TaxID=112509 RepID=F2CTQ1_HORVV|nr:predicted protein [Hordeum vulgare subsp. vulgare]